MNTAIASFSQFRHLPQQDVESRGEDGHQAWAGLRIGTLAGGVVGALVVGIAAMSTSLALPGVGTVMAGPLALAMLGAAAGATNGSLVGALIGWSIPA